MIKLLWKGKIGYGDVVSPICYAHNIAHKMQEPVELTFFWAHDAYTKIEKRDPETLWERANYIARACVRPSHEVTIIHKFSTPVDFNHVGYDWDVVGTDKYHNYWKPKQKNNPATNTIVVNSTTNNTVSLQSYGKSWKDPAAQHWPAIVRQIEQSFNVVTVDYTTPIATLFELLQTASGFVGYHGTAAWIARLVHTPSVLFADGGSLTSNAFPYARIHREYSSLIIDRLAHDFQLATKAADAFESSYDAYTPSDRLQLHLYYDHA
jgi:hypothetical protein